MPDIVGYWVLVIIGFGFLIFVHELGHFLVAKSVGIRVVRFALGFGPRLFGTNKGAEENRKGTDYCICLVPCGGYVKMAGGEGEQEATGAPDEFPSKTPGQRAMVVAAGPVMSVLVALPLLFGILTAGMERASSRINHVVPDGPAWKAGLRRGDLITGIRRKGDDSWRTIRLWRQVWLNSQLQQTVGNIELRIRRDDETTTVAMETSDKGRLGVTSMQVGTENGYVETTVGHVPDDSSAAKAGLKPGSTLLEIAGHPLHEWTDVERLFFASPGETLPVKYKSTNGAIRSAGVSVPRHKGDIYELGLHLEMPNVVGLVRPDFPAEAAGLRKGDVIANLGGRPTDNWAALRDAVLNAGGRAVLAVLRPGEEKAEGLSIKVELNPGSEMGDVLGVAPEPYPSVIGFTDDSKADDAGLQPGDKLVEVAGVKLSDVGKLQGWTAVRRATRMDDNKPVKVVIDRGGEHQEINVQPVACSVGEVDFSPRLDKCQVVPPGRPLAAAGQALRETVAWIGFACRSIWMLVTGRISAKMLSGPVLILTASRYYAEAGLLDFIEFMVIITVHLGVINLVPLPILDGGHLAFLAVEKIRGKPLSEKLVGRLMYAGMVLLICLMVFVTWNDIARLLGLG
jgi:regulator of sigma E protease